MDALRQTAKQRPAARESRYTVSHRLTEIAKMKQGILIGGALLAIAGVAFAATGYCPLCLLFWQ
jgi:hypothetical protein